MRLIRIAVANVNTTVGAVRSGDGCARPVSASAIATDAAIAPRSHHVFCGAFTT